MQMPYRTREFEPFHEQVIECSENDSGLTEANDTLQALIGNVYLSLPRDFN